MGFSSSKRRKHSKLGSTTMRAFHFRIEANAKELAKLHEALDLGFELRNDLATFLEASRKGVREAKLCGEEPQYLSAFELKKMVAAEQLPKKFGALHSQVRQDISMRVIEGQSRWFDALKAGRRHVRPPGAIARKNFRSITFPQYGTAAKIQNGKLHLSKLGEFRLIGWRKMRGAKKSITLKFKDGHFWAIVMCQVQERDVCRPYAEAKASGVADSGFDPGLAAVLNDSFGKAYDTPKPLKKAAANLRHIQKDVSRKFEMRKKLHLERLSEARKVSGSKAPVADGLVESLRKIPYSNQLKVNIKKLAKAHTKVERIRDDTAKKTARKIEKTFARAAVEEHSLQFMVKNRRLAKATADVAIGKQKQALRSALGKGRYHQAKNRRIEGGNSQTCLCGAAAPKTLKMRWHVCSDPQCGIGDTARGNPAMPRDQMSAIICQYETLGTLPSLTRVLKNSAPGLGVLENAQLANAIAILKTRRGECKGRGSESCTAESKMVKTSLAVEPSVKRLIPRTSSIQQTAGGALQNASSTGAKTSSHADVLTDNVHPWPDEAKSCVARKTRLTRLQERIPGIAPRSPLLQVGE